jgi:hypothetical protein
MEVMCIASPLRPENRLARHLHQEKREVKTMEAVIVGAALAGSFATAFWVQKAVLGAMFRAFERGKPLRP